jgi:predicted nucleotidyltransferase
MSKSVLVTISRDPLFGFTREQYIEKLKTLLSGRVDEAYFFGSFTTENFNKFSDIDIILVKETDQPFHIRAFDFADLLDLVPATDILVYTRAELDNLLSDGAAGFWKSVKESLVKFI